MSTDRETLAKRLDEARREEAHWRREAGKPDAMRHDELLHEEAVRDLYIAQDALQTWDEDGDD